MPTEETNNIAVLIDAENVDPAYAGHIMSYAYSLGNVCIREIYGSGISLNEWADPILTYSIHTNFTLRPNRYKNSSDICLVIGAMEILAATREGGRNAVVAVVIASSDSDFSALAVHLRSAGIDVIGMGEAGRCNPMWPRACTDFIPLEAKVPLTRKREETPAPSSVPAQEKKTGQSSAQTGGKQQAQAAGKPGNATAGQAAGKLGNTVAEQSADKPGSNTEAGQPSAKQGNTTNTEITAPETGKKQKKTETGKERKRKDTVRVAPTHKARIEIIRGLIAKEIEAHGGRIRSGELFRAIGSNPEYKYDQQRSRRVPMDYLKKQFGMWLGFEPQENGESLVTLKKASQPEQAEERAPETPAGETKGEKTVEQPEPLSPLARQLHEAGIPLSDAARAEEVLAGCKNLRDSYNHLRQAFGNETGKKYQQIIKDAGIQIG